MPHVDVRIRGEGRLRVSSTPTNARVRGEGRLLARVVRTGAPPASRTQKVSGRNITWERP